MISPSIPEQPTAKLGTKTQVLIVPKPQSLSTVYFRLHLPLMQTSPAVAVQSASTAQVAVPSVIRDVDEHLRPVQRELPHFIGNRLITDERPDFHAPSIELGDGYCHDQRCQSRESVAWRKTDEVLERDKFAKRHQMDLVVTRNPSSVGRDQ